jgi:hypothetical protein
VITAISAAPPASWNSTARESGWLIPATCCAWPRRPLVTPSTPACRDCERCGRAQCASAVAFAAALASLDLPLIGFESDAELRSHDRAVGVAVIPERRDPGPSARLLEERLRAAGP